MRRKATVGALGLALSFGLTAGIPAATKRNQVARSVYAAFSLVSRAKPTTTRCGTYVVTRTTLAGVATSPEPRLGGRARLTSKLSLNPGTGYGLATGTLTIRSTSGRLRLRGTLQGVISNSNVVNGIIAGTFFEPKTFLLANVTLVFNETFSFVAVRLGIESGQNSAVAYPVFRACP